MVLSSDVEIDLRSRPRFVEYRYLGFYGGKVGCRTFSYRRLLERCGYGKG